MFLSPYERTQVKTCKVLNVVSIEDHEIVSNFNAKYYYQPNKYSMYGIISSLYDNNGSDKTRRKQPRNKIITLLNWKTDFRSILYYALFPFTNLLKVNSLSLWILSKPFISARFTILYLQLSFFHKVNERRGSTFLNIE